MAKVTRAKRWYLATARHQSLAAGARNLHDLSADFSDAYLDSTVIRMRGRMRFQSNLFSAGDLPAYYMGIMVVSSEAFAAGVGSVPDPSSETVSADWMWFDTAITGDSAVDPAADAKVVVDNKSMRVMHQANKKLVLVVANPDATDTAFYSYSIRTLLMTR